MKTNTPKTPEQPADAGCISQLVRLCPHDPRTLAGLPIGQYHCPKCGEMVIAGLPHYPDVDPERINREVRKEDSEAEQKLKAKCRWEGMPRTAVIKEWGDPRSWPNAKCAGTDASGKTL